jgi:thiamine-monophosphate kinase
VVGHAPDPERFVTRAGARPGDTLVVTGELGGAAAGLLALEAGEERPDLIARQLEPKPRLAEGRMLAKAGATAMIDLSDGLGGDASHLAQASGVGLRIDAAALPLADCVTDLTLAVSGGEDYELLATIPPDRIAATPATRIGEVVAGEGVEIRLPGGALLEPAGFDQLA